MDSTKLEERSILLKLSDFLNQTPYIANIKGLFESPPLNFRVVKALEHFSSLFSSKALMWGGLKFRANL